MFYIKLIYCTILDAEEYASLINAIFIETSALNAVNVPELFMKIGKQLIFIRPQKLKIFWSYIGITLVSSSIVGVRRLWFLHYNFSISE